MLSFIKALGGSFQEAQRVESYDVLGNPGRGWYRIYTYHVGEEQYEEPVRYENETLALVLFDISAFRDQDLTEEALMRMSQIMKSFEKLGLDLILRICYDTEGKGMVREPSLFSQVKKHVAQIAEILLEHESSIAVYQGLLIGNWGEMHGSKYLRPDCLKELSEEFLAMTKGRIPLAFRRPVQYRIAFPESYKPQQIGFFNDGMLGSETHLGTFGPETEGRAAWQEPWGVRQELLFLEPFSQEVPYGGEALMPPKDLEAEEYVRTLSELHVSYLNCTYDATLMEKWKQINKDGHSLYDYIGEHLGYRFLVKQVRAKKGSRSLDVSLEIANEGFGCLCEDAVVQIMTGKGDGADTVLGTLDGSLKAFQGKETRTLKGSFPMDGILSQGNTAQIYARILRCRDERLIRFAQKDINGCLMLGELR
ncbi:MAG: DUF4874 domain-containing protein [Lachnospiraceae bacterium]|nr:DUF4874 domain-containing protein [Lachnospiraceae bacterium]